MTAPTERDAASPATACAVPTGRDAASRVLLRVLAGGPVVLPPCLKCGARTDYYAAGLCIRCHPWGDPGPDSCRDCLAWGARRTHKWLCRCTAWREKYQPRQWQRDRPLRRLRPHSTSVPTASAGSASSMRPTFVNPTSPSTRSLPTNTASNSSSPTCSPSTRIP